MAATQRPVHEAHIVRAATQTDDVSIDPSKMYMLAQLKDLFFHRIGCVLKLLRNCYDGIKKVSMKENTNESSWAHTRVRRFVSVFPGGLPDVKVPESLGSIRNQGKISALS